MLDREIAELSQLQLQRAEELINYIPQYISLGDYNTAVNRAYYAAFHSMKAVEILNGYDSKKHSGVIAFFRQNYIKTNIFDTALSEIIGELQVAREDSDYDMIIRFTADEASDCYEKAKTFVETIKDYLKDIL